MVIGRLEDLIHQLPVIGHQQQPLGVLIQPAHGVDPLRIIQETDDVILLPFIICGTDDPPGFIYRQHHRLLFAAGPPAVHQDLLVCRDLLAHEGRLAVHQYSALLHQPVCLPSGTDACFTQVLI